MKSWVGLHSIRNLEFQNWEMNRNDGWSMIIGDYTNQYIGDYHTPLKESRSQPTSIKGQHRVLNTAHMSH